MRNFCKLALVFTFLIFINVSHAMIATTKRIPQFSNDKVKIWKTILYPTSKQILKMHRHEHDRVLVALTGGRLKITNNKGKVHYLNLEKDKVYYLSKDIPHELHTDENVSTHPIKVIVIEFK